MPISEFFAPIDIFSHSLASICKCRGATTPPRRTWPISVAEARVKKIGIFEALTRTRIYANKTHTDIGISCTRDLVDEASERAATSCDDEKVSGERKDSEPKDNAQIFSIVLGVCVCFGVVSA